ncbi:MAG: EamA family transporter [Rhizobiales bacterium]|nr:EamA family transporter [Hyphomicrobiales bacterium]
MTPPGHRENDTLRGLVLGVVAVTIFGLTLPATRIGVAEIDPILFGLGRAVIPGILSAVLLLATRQKLPSWNDFLLLGITAAGVVIGFPALATIAMQEVPAAHGGVVLALLPLATALTGTLIGGERPSLGFWLCAVIGSLIVVVFAVSQGGDVWHLQSGDLLLLLATASAAIGYATGGRLSRHLGGWQVICWALVLALPVVCVIVYLTTERYNWEASATAWLAFGYVAIFSQWLGFFAWNAGLALGGIARVGQLQLLQPFVTLAGAAVLVGERITVVEILFAGAVVVTVAIGRRMVIRRS